MLAAALHNIRSLYNVGSIFRTASGAGFDRLFLSGYTGRPPHPRIAKVGLGAEEEIPHTPCDDIDRLLEELSGHFVVAMERHPESVFYNELEPPRDRPVTVVVGNEILGVPERLVERADAIVEIPMAGKKEVLNVSCAFAVVAYDLGIKLGRVGNRQLLRHNPPDPPRPGVLTGDAQR